jgi:uncharacterized repeat protein (TIGR03803 family)
MKNTKSLCAKIFHGVVGIIAVAIVCAASAANAQTTQKVLHDFAGTDGGYPVGNLISDSAGNLYGAAGIGGEQNTSGCYPSYPGFASYCGTIFKLTKSASGWTTSVLHEFTGGSDGGNPAAGLIFDSAGNLYGTTAAGGDCPYAYGCGVVYELSPTASGPWTETVLYSFQCGNDGCSSESPLVFDSSGNLYGTASGGGNGSCGLGVPCGVVFKLSPSSNAPWTETVLYNFQGFSDGETPAGPVVFDSKGNLYGTTSFGGSVDDLCGYPFYGCGLVSQLSPNSSGEWTKTTLYTFNGGVGGAYAADGLIIDSKGTLYGVTTAGGVRQWCGDNRITGCGVIYALRQNSSGGWRESVLLTFQPGGAGGQLPNGGLTLDAAGNLYGTANKGVTSQSGKGAGVVFELSPGSNNSWNETVLYTFPGSDTKGSDPVSSPILDSAGNIFGTTSFGGTLSYPYCDGTCGVVYEVTP